MENKESLITLAHEAATRAYAPYSKFRVGAALLCKDGTIFKGANIENRSFGLTNCAERSALFAALSQGYKDFIGLAIACPDADYPVPPCGACRQVISEFVSDKFPIYYQGGKGEIVSKTMGDLLPEDSLKELSK